MNHRKQKKVAVSWSGGKDACLALYRVLKDNDEVVCLVSMVSNRDGRNHAHGVPLHVLEMQANALGIPLVLVDSAGEYEKSLENSLIHIKKQFGIEAIVFGSLYAEDDRRWNETVANHAGLEPLFPVWTTNIESVQLFHEFVGLGFKTIVCRASEKYFDKSWVGRNLDNNFYQDVQKMDICMMGEMGEYHTFVLDGPIFQHPITITKSEVVLNSELWSLDILECQ